MRWLLLLLISEASILLQLDLFSSHVCGFQIDSTRAAFVTSSLSSRRRPFQKSIISSSRQSIIWRRLGDTDDSSSDEPEEFTIFRGSDDDPLTQDIWEDLETGQPPKWMVVKELLGISSFTYVLAAAIVIGLSLNFFLGPGWLGQVLGLSGTGSFTESSGSLPDSLDLSDPAYLL